MSSFQRLCLVALLALPLALRAQSQWNAHASIPNYDVYAGSGVCCGDTGGENMVFVLCGEDDGGQGNMQIYHPLTDAWDNPSSYFMPWGPGGAVCWYRGAYGGGGYVFALSGDNSPDFWAFPAGGSEWQRVTGEDLPDNATDGGALCWGGFHWSQDEQTEWGYLFAFSGTENVQGQGRFFRFNMPQYPALEENSWSNVAPLPYSVGKGGALVWMPPSSGNNQPEASQGYVYALRGYDGGPTYSLYRYSVAANTWGNPWYLTLPYGVTQGAALAADTVNHLVYIFTGNYGGSRHFLIWHEGTLTIDELETPSGDFEHYGASICWDPLDGQVYAEFGEDNRDWKSYGPALFRGYGGGQSLGTSPRVQGAAIRVVADGTAHHFLVKNTDASTVHLTVSDVTGRRLSSSVAMVKAHSAELAWSHASAAPGVYFYLIEAGSRALSGKLLLVR